MVCVVGLLIVVTMITTNIFHCELLLRRVAAWVSEELQVKRLLGLHHAVVLTMAHALHHVQRQAALLASCNLRAFVSAFITQIF